MNPLPLLIGSESHFRTVRDAFAASGFTETEVCARTGCKKISGFEPALDPPRNLNDALDLLIALLMDGVILDESAVLRHLAPNVLEALEALNVLDRDPETGRQLYATVSISPVAGVYAAADRSRLPDFLSHLKVPEDVVYPPITSNTGRFLSILPEEPCEDLLDLCSGSGVAALAAGARYAKHAWATDLGPRCVHYAEFGRRLNGLENVASVQGDLYEAIGDRTFDRISAHPPYVPKKDREFLFRDGGEDGEQILRRIVEGLPKHLRPGGRYYCVCFATDREGETLQQRLRKWLGPAEAEFDLAILTSENRQRPTTILEALQKAKGRLGKLSDSAQLLEDLKVTNLVYGVIVIARTAAGRPPATGRIHKAASAASDAVEWYRHWLAFTARPDFAQRLFTAHPVAAGRLQLQVTHRPVEGVLTPLEFKLRTDYPFQSEGAVDSWVAVLVGQCDGRSTGAELYTQLKNQEVIAPDMDQPEFAGVLQLLLTNGLLELKEAPLPAAQP